MVILENSKDLRKCCPLLDWNQDTTSRDNPNTRDGWSSMDLSTDGDANLFDEVVANLCNTMTARDFEKVCTNAMLCHSLVGKDTAHFSCDYVLVELVLFSCKIALEKEKHILHILPFYGNTAESRLGAYLKSFLDNLPRNKISRITEPIEKICYVCLRSLMRDGEIEKYYPVTLPMDMAEILSYFEEYVRFYKLI